MKYAFKNEAESVSVRIYDEIGDDGWGGGITANDIQEQLDNANGKPLNIYINSYGGEVFEGFAIYNSIMNYNGYKTVYVDGICASIASVIAMAGNRIIMNKASMIMIHNASGMAFGNAKEMQKVVNALEQINEVIRDVYKTRTGMCDDELATLMDNETFMTPQEAVNYGFADEIVESKVSEEATEVATENLMQSLENRINQLKEIKNCFEVPTHDDVSVADEEKPLKNKSKMDWLRNGGIF